MVTQTQTQMNSVALIEFTLYPKLPLEIHYRITHHAIPIFLQILQVTGNEIVQHDYDVLSISMTPLLRIDHDIRAEVMSSYTAPFTFTGTSTSGSGRLAQNVWVNWQIDTLYIGSIGGRSFHLKMDGFWEKLFGENLTQVKNGLQRLAGSASSSGFWETALSSSIWSGENSPKDFSTVKAFDQFVALKK